MIFIHHYTKPTTITMITNNDKEHNEQYIMIILDRLTYGCFHVYGCFSLSLYLYMWFIGKSSP